MTHNYALFPWLIHRAEKAWVIVNQGVFFLFWKEITTHKWLALSPWHTNPRRRKRQWVLPEPSLPYRQIPCLAEKHIEIYDWFPLSVLEPLSWKNIGSIMASLSIQRPNLAQFSVSAQHGWALHFRDNRATRFKVYLYTVEVLVLS